MTRSQRLQLFLRRMRKLPPAKNAEEALQKLSDILTQIEDIHSGAPNDPARWMELDRMFPPQADNIERLAHRPGVLRANTRGHVVLIGANGSLEMHERPSRRRGCDGKISRAAGRGW